VITQTKCTYCTILRYGFKDLHYEISPRIIPVKPMSADDKRIVLDRYIFFLSVYLIIIYDMKHCYKYIFTDQVF
jgi:hypothetical protein